MLIPLFPSEPPHKDGSANAPFQIHGNPDAEDAPSQRNAEHIPEYDAEQPHAEHGRR
ncbi:hypothetical protein D3C84_1294160 [compost metagenome]